MLVSAFLLCLSVVSACHNPLIAQELVGSAKAIGFFGSTGSQLGHNVNAAGDLNNDGYDDFVLAAPYASARLSGEVYVIFGRSIEKWAKVQNIDFNVTDTPYAGSWIRISNNNGTASNEALGANGLAHGDYNGDGVSDLVISAYSIGRAIVVYGHSGAWHSFDINDVYNGDIPGFVVSAQYSVFCGNAGDMNGDGIDDLLVTEFTASIYYPSIVFGQPDNDRENFNLSTVDGVNGFKIAVSDSRLGSGFFNPGDMNGDGIADLLIGGHATSNAYILFAKNLSIAGNNWNTSIDLSTLDGTDGFVITGNPKDYVGWSVVAAGDLNNDGFEDIYITSITKTGGAWVVFGHAMPWTSPFNASTVSGTTGFHFYSDRAGDEYFGSSAGGGAGDVNGDGIDDLVIGGWQAYNFDNISQTGAAVVIFGRRKGVAWPAEIARKDVVGSVGFQIDGPTIGVGFGYSARGVGDLNGDGIADIAIGANDYNNQQGFAVLVFGVNDHCAVCSSTSDVCLVCRDGFTWNGTACELASVSTSHATTSTVVVISDGASVAEVLAEIVTLLGVDPSAITVVEITPGTFEITVSSESLAHQLVDAIHQCMDRQ